MRAGLTLVLMGLGVAACSYDYTPPDTNGGYDSDKLLRVFARECVEERSSLAREISDATRGVACLGDDDCERDTLGYYTWTPADADELEIAMQSDAHMLAQERGDGWHCSARFWRRPDDAVLDRLSRLASAQGLTRHETWEEGEGQDRIVWHVWRPADAEVPELRLIQLERPKPWTLLYVE